MIGCENEFILMIWVRTQYDQPDNFCISLGSGRNNNMKLSKAHVECMCVQTNFTIFTIIAKDACRVD